MALSINEYRDYIKKRNFTQNPSHYRMIVPEITRVCSPFVCYPDSILLPGTNFTNTPFSYVGEEFTFPLRREYNELSVNFIVYQDWKERRIFEQWMSEMINTTEARTDRRPASSHANNFLDYLKDIKIEFVERGGVGKTANNYKNNQVIILEKTYPLLITPTNFAADNSGYTVFTVNFAIRRIRYETTYTSYNTGDVPSLNF